MTPAIAHPRLAMRRLRGVTAGAGPLRTHTQFAAFAAVGAGNTAIDATVFTLLVMLLDWRSGALAVLASSVGFLAGAAHSYAWNSRFTFGRTHVGDSLVSVSRFLVAVASGAVIAAAAFWLVAAGWPHEASRLAVAKLAATAVAMGWNFSLMRHWVFRRRRPAATSLPARPPRTAEG